MSTLLIVHHTPSPHCQAMFEAVVAGASDPEIEGVEVVRRAALSVTASDFLAADGYLLGSPVNLGYLSGALKHAFDVSYYQILDSTRGRPYGLYLHGNEGTEGAVRAAESITTGLGWVRAAEHVIASNKPAKADLEASYKPSVSTRYKAHVAKADAAYDLAREHCNEKTANEKDVCVKEAKAVQTAALADAKVQQKTTEANIKATEKKIDANVTAMDDKNTANYKVAYEKCDSFAGAPKTTCQEQAKKTYGK